MIILVTALLLWATARAIHLTLRGFEAPPPEKDFVAVLAIEKQFTQDPGLVEAAYRLAARDTPGMSIAEQKEGVFLIDSRPTIRIMSGDFGSILRITVAAAGAGSRLMVEYTPKSASKFVRSHAGAFTEKERALRMRAKRLGGLTETTSSAAPTPDTGFGDPVPRPPHGSTSKSPRRQHTELDY